jgi:hypothetical protein
MNELPKYSISWTQVYSPSYTLTCKPGSTITVTGVNESQIEYDLERSKLNEAKEVLDRIKNL